LQALQLSALVKGYNQVELAIRVAVILLAQHIIVLEAADIGPVLVDSGDAKLEGFRASYSSI
jgi:hypothetical protein